MKERLLEWLACPTCGDDLTLHPTRSEKRHIWEAQREEGETLDTQEILEGHLHCATCNVQFPITEGIPRLLPPAQAAGPSTGHRWTEFSQAVPEYEENFLDLSAPLHPGDFMGRLVLDAGCGFGRHAFFAARYGAEIIALDHSPEAIASASRNIGDQQRAHIIQGDIHHPPLKKGIFDIVYSYGVLHHVEEARSAFATLTELVKAGGRLSIWAYGPRQGLTRIISGALRGATSEMTPKQLHNFSRVIAGGLRVFSHTPYAMMREVPGVRGVVSHLPVHDHYRWPFDVVVADVYDRLRVPVTGYFRGEELEKWYAEAGYADIRVSRRVRNNESFRATGIRR